MSPTLRLWLEGAGWLAAIVFWFWLTAGLIPWWQPALIWFGFALLSLAVKRLGYSAGALPLTALLAVISWVFLFRLDPELAGRQCIGIMLGFVAYGLGLLIPWIRRCPYLYYLIPALTLLTATLLWGKRVGGALAWLEWGSFRFQPVEFVRVLLVLFLARYLWEHQDRKDWSWRWPVFALLGAVGLILALQRDLGPALLIFWVSCFLSLSLSFSWLRSFLYLAGGLGAFFSSLFVFPHVQTRVSAWLHPWDHAQTKGYQILQGLFALGAGGLFGQGLGEGLAGYIPEAATDYLLAVIGEEFGFLGTFSLILIYVALAFWSFRLLKEVPEGPDRAIGLGLILLLHLQVFLVIGGMLRFWPFTGLTLPFISFGSSSFVAQMWMLGIFTGLRRI